MILMGVSWMFMILLGCRLTQATQSENSCNYDDKLFSSEDVCEPDSERLIPCPSVDADIMTFKILKGNKCISLIRCERNFSLSCTPNETVRITKTQPVSISFILPTKHSHGSYRCEGTTDFPPPIKHVPSEVNVKVIGPKCSKDKEKTNGCHEFTWIWILAVAVLVVYGITLTVIAFVIWIKLKKTDNQSDYMNTHPRLPRGHKKRGVQNPIPKHF